MADSEESGSGKRPFHERGSFKAAVAVVGLLGGLWAFLGTPKPFELAKDLTDDPLPLRNTEIILDASARMGEPFGKGTKLEVAVAAASQYAAAGQHVGLALRRAGGGCEEAGEPIVGFDDGQSAAIRETAREQEPGGESNLTLQVLAAIGDFSGAAFHRPGSENQIVVFVGSDDSCPFLGAADIRSELEHANVDASFHLFALDVSEQAMGGLESLARQLEPVATVELQEAESVEQLYEQIQDDVPGVEASAFEPLTSSEEALPEADAEATGEEPGGEAEEELQEEEPEALEEAPPVEEGGGEAEEAAP